MTGGGDVPPPPPPEEEHEVRAAATITNPKIGRRVRRARRPARGRITIASTTPEPGHPLKGIGGSADDVVWLVVICKVTVPVAPAATEALGGLMALAALVGSVPN